MLRPNQIEAVAFLSLIDKGMILAPVGAGKTAITLTAMKEALDTGRVHRFLVIAPKRVCTDVWTIEPAKWAPSLTVSIAVGSLNQRLAAFDAPSQVVVTNYDTLQTLPPLSKFDGVVFDELTVLKNPSGKRFKALFARIKDFKIKWGLTGSFTSNGLEDVFGQCKIVDAALLGKSKIAFLQTYFVLLNKDFGEWVAKSTSLRDVMAEIKPATYLIDTQEYMDTLPPLNVVPVKCAMDMKQYGEMKKDFVVYYEEKEIIAVNAAVVVNKLQQMASGFSYIEGQPAAWFSRHKFDRLDEILEENQHANTIIVYNFQAELEELKRRYPNARTIDQQGVISSWNAGRVELLLVHPKSAGHGLNLQFGGSKMVFLSLPWSLDRYEQTIGRLHRSGQKSAVYCYVLLTDKTVDERIFASLHDKRAISDIALEELK
jgi:SNF2 family DNA or RNA helicase